MTTLRCFPEATELHAQNWRDSLVTDEAWEIIGNPGEAQGESRGFFVRLDDLKGFAKPSQLKPDKFRAGHEKIASDLAFELGLPVPPVVLWHRSVSDETEEPYLSISMVPFLPIYKWKIIEQKPEAAKRIGTQLNAVASAMVAFDTWLGNRDRNNDGNLLANEEEIPPASGDEAGVTVAENTAEDNEEHGDDREGSDPVDEERRETVVRAAYIDLSYALSDQWSDDRYKTISPAPLYPKQAVLQKDELDGMIGMIEALPIKIVQDVVKHIPDGYLSKDRREIALTGLMYRQTHLRENLDTILRNTQGEHPQ